jgi:DNA-binding MarR family transcriptional regulator
MSEDSQAIKYYFERLGLETEIADLYTALHIYGAQTISELARTSNVERTRIYRLIDELEHSNLIEIETHYRRKILKAAPITNLHILLTKKEEELRSLRNELQDIDETLRRNSLTSPLTRVQFYRGPEGLKQMFWNQTKAKGESTSTLYQNMQNRTNETFFARWVERCNERGLGFRGIVSEHFISTQKDWYATHTNERLKNWAARYVPDNTFKITHATTVYDDVVVYHNWLDGEVFGIEIYNHEIAGAQRQLFEMLWQQAEPVDDLKGPVV